MVIKTAAFVLSMFLALSGPAAVQGDEIGWEMVSAEYMDIRSVLFTHDDPGEVFAGSGSAVIRGSMPGSDWRALFTVKGGDKRINALLQDGADSGLLYAATSEGLFISRDKGRRWERLFRGRDYLERECLALAAYKENIYLGTAAGLRVSADQGRSWRKAPGKLGDSRIFSLAVDRQGPGCVYAASAAEVYRAVWPSGAWDKIYGGAVLEDEIDPEEYVEEEDPSRVRAGIRYLALSSDAPARIYLATGRGVYECAPGSKDWRALTAYGLFSSDIYFLAVSRQGILYAMNSRGIFFYEGKRWHECSSRLAGGEIATLGWDRQDNLYAGCEKGLYRAIINVTPEVARSSPGGNPADGIPSIKQTQQAAIVYAEVAPEKIERWRRQAARKAWLPELNMGLARDTSELFHWEGGSTTKADDDILRKGRDTLDWDISLKWDLSGIIWNEDQTSIDARSRLMVELRQDILDEVTKLYFERIRVEKELEDLRLEESGKRSDKQLRLKELTASLDGLTGGYFSARTR